LITTIYIGTEKLDLFEEDNIQVVDSVVDISDITKNNTSFTKTFTVPASDANNKTFKHYYDANIDNSFDSRTKQAGRIELDGMPFKLGKFTLRKVSVKKNVPTSYTINFTGNLVDIKTKVKKDELSKLDLSAYDHAHDSANVSTGLSSSLSSGAVIYPLMAKKQYYFDSVSDNTQTEILSNISFDGGADTGVVWSDLRPAIKVISIIEAIETDYNLTFSRDFFGTTEFTDLFLWLNNSSSRTLVGNRQLVSFQTNGVDTYMNVSTNVGTYPMSYGGAGGFVYFKLELQITPNVSSNSIEYSILMYRDGELIRETTHTGADTQSTLIYPEGSGTSSAQVYYEVRANQDFTYTSRIRQIKRINIVSQTPEDNLGASQTITTTFVVSDNIPKIKIIDFIRGLMQAYKLVLIAENDGTIFVDTLNNYYADGTTYDITKYTDFESFEAERGKILNEISLKFQEPTTIGNVQFLENTGASYGDEEVILTDDGTADGELLDGDALTVELPFEQIVYERLTDQTGNAETNIQYARITDHELNPVSPKPHLFYNVNNSLGTKTIGFISDTGNQTEKATANVPSHTNTFLDPVYSTIFGSEQNEYSGDTIINTLYKRHYENFILSIFNIKKRTFKYKAWLPLGIILKLKLNDVLKIKGNYYRPTKNTYNITTGEVGLELVNTFDNKVNSFRTNTNLISKDFTAGTVTLTINNSLGASSSKSDIGSGTGWLTVSTLSATPNTFYLAFTKNTTDPVRSMLVTFTQATTGATVEVLVNQYLE
jgi:hypothetical protein